MQLGRWFTYSDRKHWELDNRWFRLARWCPGAPCHLRGVRYKRHWVHVIVWHRKDSARERD